MALRAGRRFGVDSSVPGRVLVVDDDATLRTVVQRILESEGYVVETASDGNEALDRIQSGPPDLVLLDLMMPIMDGWQVLERLRGVTAHPPVIVLSAYLDRGRVLDAGAVDCLPKPFRMRDLLRTCQKALGTGAN